MRRKLNHKVGVGYRQGLEVTNGRYWQQILLKKHKLSNGKRTF